MEFERMQSNIVERGCWVKDDVLKKKKGMGQSAVDKNSTIYIHEMETDTSRTIDVGKAIVISSSGFSCNCKII